MLLFVSITVTLIVGNRYTLGRKKGKRNESLFARMLQAVQYVAVVAINRQGNTLHRSLFQCTMSWFYVWTLYLL